MCDTIIASLALFDKNRKIRSNEKICGIRRKKTSLEESLAESHAYIPIRNSGETLGEREKSRQKSNRDSLTDSRLRLLARLLARLFVLAKRLPRVSDRIICLAFRRTLSGTGFFTRIRLKKRVLERVLPRVMHIIQSETLGETLDEHEKRASRRGSRFGVYYIYA